MTGIIRWEDPPRAGRGAGAKFDSHAVAAELRANPGRWALVRLTPGAMGFAWHIENARDISAFAPRGSFEACSRSTPEGIATYARYIGGAS